MSTSAPFIPNLVKSVHGGILGKRVEYKFLVIFIFSSEQHRKQTRRRILTRDGSKDAE